MPVGEEDPKVAGDKELKRPDTQKLLREMRGKEGTQHNSEEFRLGYAFAFELTDYQRNEVLDLVTRTGCSIHEAMKTLKLGGA